MTIAVYPKYECMSATQAAHLPVIPGHWEARRVKHAANLKSEKVPSKECDLPYIGMENVQSWSGNLLEGGSEVEGLATTFEAGDILFGKLRPYLAKVAKPDFSGMCSSEFLVFQSTNDTFGDFLAYALRSSDFISLINGSTYGAKMPRANPSFIANSEIPFPPLPEQRAIAAFLDNKCAKIDEAVRIKEAQIKLLRERRQILIQQAVTRGLNPDVPMKDSGIDWIGEIPVHWEVKRNKHMFVEINERSARGEEQHLSMSQKLGLVRANLVEKSLSSESYQGAKLVQKGDLVLNRLKAHLAVFSLAPMDGLVSPDYSVFQPLTQGALSDYFEILFKTSKYLGEFRLRVRGIVEGFYRLYTNDFMDCPLIIPPLDEQIEIVRYVRKTSEKFGNAIEIKESQIGKLKEYKASLVNAAVTGKIKVS